ncbi:hypothetical protein [Limnoglobus roseus]|uniref:Tetratricopeptide repeat protein n=1 Tax=Limnoglobus roseus TaxID=2598579 RepID=A0A5C1ABP5_9BACT|nr:hypothetical protein [Limnoglobus roseus]QEL16130.1 hypothetical protein PX52LOC_03069 [Limnoglobus roseus]
MNRFRVALFISLSAAVVAVAAPVPTAPVDNRAAQKALRDATEVLDKVTGDVQSRVQLWCSIADFAHALDDKSAATVAVQKATAVAATSRGVPVEEWRYIGRTLGKFGEADAVLKLLEGVPAVVENRRGNPRQTILQESATAAATAGHLQAAEKLAEAIPDEKLRASMLKSLRPLAAGKTAKASDKDVQQSLDALTTADEKFTFLVGRTYMMLAFDTDSFGNNVASTKLRAGDKAGAKDAAQKALALLPDLEDKRQLGAAMAVLHILAKLDDVAAAKKLYAEQIARSTEKPSQWKLVAEVTLAAAEVRLGQDAEALKRVQAFTVPGEQAYVLQYIAQAQGTAGRKKDSAANFAKAVELVGQAPDGPGTTFHNIASAQARAGDFERAGRTAALLGQNGTIAWTNIIGSQVHAGDFDGARKNAIEHVTDGSRFWLANTMETIASGQAAAGKADAAREWIDKMDDPLLKAHAMVGLAQGLYREMKKK